MATRRSNSTPIKIAERPDSAARIEAGLHAACIKAGAAAALQVALDRLPLLKPFLPAAVIKAARSDMPERIQRQLVKSIFTGHAITPARWEVEGILAVAQTQAVLAPMTSKETIHSLVGRWLPERVGTALVRFTPIEPLTAATTKAIAGTWAAGRYADSVCRLRRAGVNWLPAPISNAMKMAPETLRRWSAEALLKALPPLRLANALGLEKPNSVAAKKITKHPVRR